MQKSHSVTKLQCHSYHHILAWLVERIVAKAEIVLCDSAVGVLKAAPEGRSH